MQAQLEAWSPSLYVYVLFAKYYDFSFLSLLFC